MAQGELEAIFPSRKAFLQAVMITATECRFYWAADGGNFTLSAPLRVILGFAGDPVRFVFKGAVMKLVDEALRGQRTGAVIRVQGDEQRAFGAAVAYARGEDPSLGRRTKPRWSTRIPALLGDGLVSKAILLDISEGGAFAQLTQEAPPVGSFQPLGIDVDGAREIIGARVAWIGRRDGVPGCGLEFLELSDGAKRWLARTLAEASRGA